MAKYIIQDSTLSSIANAIRQQTGKDSSEKLSPAQMVNEIQNTLGDFPGLVGRTLTDIKHSGVETIAPYAFYHYSTLKTVEFPNCTTVGASAFVSCTGLTSISLPNCSNPPSNAFTGCTKVQSATLGVASLSGTSSTTNFPLNVAKANIADINLPHCSSIGVYTFKNYTKLQNISAPVCTAVMGQAFSSCINLTNVYLPECSLIGNVSTTFKGCTKVSNVTLGLSELTSTNFPFPDTEGSSITELHFPNCISIESMVFRLDSTIIRYPNISVVEFLACKKIPYYTFANYGSLTSVNFPACTSIGNSAFRSCSSLTSVDFPACTGIGSDVFRSCSSLTSVDFPACTRIGSDAFIYCSGLTSVNFPICQRVEGQAFRSCSSLTSVNFPACTYINDAAFYDCSSLTSVNFPACTGIANNAFDGCQNLTTVILGAASVASIITINTFSKTPIVDSSYTGSFGSIYVPASLVNAYKVASYWSDIADRITAIVE